MLIFLNNMFNSKTSVKITPWLSLKKTIFEVYELRCQGCAELEASVGGAYVTMDEFASLYFMNVLASQQKNGTRRNAEKKMLTFVASLKFYARIWPRAFLFARLANIVGRAALPGTFKNTSIDEYDVFTQQYFAWAFKVLLGLKDAAKDFSDGYTYLLKPDAQSFASAALFFLGAQEQTKFDARLQREVKPVNKPGAKPFDGIDADLLLTMVLEEFVECRARILKNLKARYFKQYEVDRGSPGSRRQHQRRAVQSHLRRGQARVPVRRRVLRQPDQPLPRARLPLRADLRRELAHSRSQRLCRRLPPLRPRLALPSHPPQRQTHRRRLRAGVLSVDPAPRAQTTCCPSLRPRPAPICRPAPSWTRKTRWA